jgi:hypothetical protein
VETGKLMATFRAAMSSRILAFSSDKGWVNIQNPERENRQVPSCWVPFESSFIGGDTSNVPSIEP